MQRLLGCSMIITCFDHNSSTFLLHKLKVCHGIPDSRILQNGDMISIDVSVYLDGFHGDNCGTIIAGQGDAAATTLLNVTQAALDEAIALCRPGMLDFFQFLNIY